MVSQHLQVAPLRVTFCAYDKPGNVGGPPAWLQRLLPALRVRGIECRCLFLLHFGDSGPSLDFLRDNGFECSAVLAHETTEDRVEWILSQLSEHPPDIFVANYVLAGYFAGAFLRKLGCPTIGVLHSDDPFYRGLQDQFVFGNDSQRLSAVVCVSQEIERQVRMRRPQVTVSRIGCGGPLSPTAVTTKPGILRVGYVGRLADEQKRISDVARAFCRMVLEVDGVEAVIYGDGPERKVVEEILAKEGQGLPVKLGGLIDSNQIQQHLLACDVIVLLSDYEGLPIALMEAMACGCVPVCLRIRSGIPELVEDGITGLLVDDRSDDFVAAIRRLKFDAKLWANLSQAAKLKIQREHSIEAGAEKWSKLLQQLDREAPPKKTVCLPRKLRLPSPHASMKSFDVRCIAVPQWLAWVRRARLQLGRIKRRFVK